MGLLATSLLCPVRISALRTPKERMDTTGLRPLLEKTVYIVIFLKRAITNLKFYNIVSIICFLIHCHPNRIVI